MINDRIASLSPMDQQTYALLLKMQNETQPIEPSLESLLTIHKELFAGFLPTAGQIRTHNLWKGIYFCMEKNLSDQLNQWFGRFAKFYKTMTIRNIPELAAYYCHLNWIHPFDEGNGRVQREFFRRLLAKKGCVFNLSQTTHKDMIEASFLAIRDKNPLKMADIFEKTIRPNDDCMEYYANLPYLAILSQDDISLGIANYSKRKAKIIQREGT